MAHLYDSLTPTVSLRGERQLTMTTQGVETPDGISWHVEYFPSNDQQDLSKDVIVLIPSGEGDCQNLLALAALLCRKYSVLTFDMPGFSRTKAPTDAYAKVTPQLLASQIVTLLDALQISQATFFGCSSGGAATLALCSLHPDRVKCGIVHEVPFEAPEMLSSLQKLPDVEISPICKDIFANGFVEQENNGRTKWEALGPEYHSRLAKNYVTWIRGYADSVEVAAHELASDPENLKRRPIFWTVGSLNADSENQNGVWKRNFEMAKKAGLTVENKTLNCLHFPSVTVPEELAKWIEDCVDSVAD